MGEDEAAVAAALGRPCDGAIDAIEASHRLGSWSIGDYQLLVEFDGDGRSVAAWAGRSKPTAPEWVRRWWPW
jgi:hypothetical protein